MKAVRLVLMVLIVSSLAAGCGGGDGDTNGGGDFSAVATQPAITGLYGKVTSTQGEALAGATVEAGGASATTGADGRFELPLSATGATLVRCRAAGYLNGIQWASVQSGKGTTANFALREMGPALPLDVATGGAVSEARNAGIVAPAEAFVDRAGQPVVGQVAVHLTPLDPSKPMELLAFPGDLVAEASAGGQVLLESYGVLEVTIVQDGEELQVAEGKTLSLRIPAPEGATNPPATMPMWYFDEEAGIWKEEGTVTYNAADHVYEGEVAHLSYWNADVGTPAACLSGRVLDGGGQPVVGARVVANGVGYNGATTATTDAEGRFCVAVMPGAEIRLTISDGNGRVAQMTATAGAANVNLPLDCATAACTEIGDIDMAVSGADCADFVNLFRGTCVEDMMVLSECMDMSGGCRIELDGDSVSISYESGARIVTTTTGGYDTEVFTAESTYYGAGGAECGSGVTEGDIDGESDMVTSITMRDGSVWRITFHEDDGSATYECPSGEQVHVTSAQMDAMDACMGGGDEEQCTVSGDIGGVSTCETNADCDEGLVCAEVSGVRFCQPDMGEYSCSSDADCEGGMRCCDMGFLAVCMPECP